MSDRPTIIKRFRRPLGKVRRWVKRRWWSRLTGRHYRRWLKEAQRIEPGSAPGAERVAVIVPVFNPPVELLRECLASVLAQEARAWQLIVVDDGSIDDAVTTFLTQFQDANAADERVTVLRTGNSGISAALNAGLEHVRTSHVGWLDHDDMLDPRCIRMFTDVIEACDPDIVYSDEDKVDEQGRHFEPYAKPDFSPELLMTQMYLCHFTTFRTDLLRSIGGFRSEMDGAQDFDVALRLLPLVGKVEHLAYPLYHWRWWSQSTAKSIEAKPWALEATTRVQRDYLDRTFGGGEVKPGRVRGLNDVHPRLEHSPLVSVIIPTAGAIDPTTGRTHVEAAIETLRAQETSTALEIIVVVTGEPFDDMSAIDADAMVTYTPESTFNFSEAINLGRQHARGEYLFLLNDDTRALTADPITRMLELGQVPGVGIVGCALEYPDHRLQHAGIVLIPGGPTHCWIVKDADSPGYFGSLLTPRNYSAVTAAAMLVTAAAFDEASGFDPVFARDFNDVDFCLRVAHAGWRTAWTPYARFVHYEGTSLVRKAADPGEWQEFRSRHRKTLERDPYYSPALGQSIERLYDIR